MNITREHLELAAKAAGYMGVDFSEVNEGGYAWRVSGQLGAPWRPHEVKADAVQLAEDCGMTLDFGNGQVFYPVTDEGDDYIGMWFGDGVVDNWMQAVTLAAAEIGRAMK